MSFPRPEQEDDEPLTPFERVLFVVLCLISFAGLAALAWGLVKRLWGA